MKILGEYKMICAEKGQSIGIDDVTEKVIVILTNAEDYALPKRVREVVQKETVFEDASIGSFFKSRIGNKQVYIIVCHSIEKGWPEDFPTQLERISGIISTIDEQNIGIYCKALPPDNNTETLVDALKKSPKNLVLYNRKGH